MTAVAFTINGKAVNVEAEPDTALLWVVREHLKLTGTKYGCGSGLCGASRANVIAGNFILTHPISSTPKKPRIYGHFLIA